MKKSYKKYGTAPSGRQNYKKGQGKKQKGTFNYPLLIQHILREAKLYLSTLEETLKYRKFKAAGTEGILNCKIASIIKPLIADHLLREANHYIRLLK